MRNFLFVVTIVLLSVFIANFAFSAGPQPAQPSITVLSPNGGENLVIGQTYSITWQSFGLSQVNINLWSWESVSNSHRVSIIAKNLNALRGSYSWIIPEKTECLSLPCLSLPEFSYHKIQVVDSRYGRDSSVPQVISDEGGAFRIEVSPPIPPSLTKIKVGEWLTIICGVDVNNDWLNITLDPNQWDIKNVRISPPSDGNEFFVTYHGLQKCNGFFAQITSRHSAAVLIVFDIRPKTNGFLKIHYVYGSQYKLEGDWLYEGISPTLSGAAPKMAKNGATTWGKIKS